MSNVLIISGDPHLGDRQINTRIDSTFDTTLRKLQFIVDTVFGRDALGYLSPGDNFSEQLRSKRYERMLRDVLGPLRDKKHFWTTIGNHSGDMRGKDPQSYLYKDTGILEHDGYLTKLKEEKIGGRWFKGISAYEDTYLTSDNPIEIVVCHHFIADAFDDELVIYPDKLKEALPNLKLIIAGHDHSFYEEITSTSGVRVVRPGSLMRNSSSKSNDRVPLLVALDLDTLDIEYIPVPCGEFKELFRLDQKDIKKDAEKEALKFAAQFKDAQNIHVSIEDIIKDMLDKLKMDPVAYTYIKQDLVKAGFMIERS